MISTIFRTETNGAEEWLTLDADGMLTHYVENSGWAMARSSPLPRENRMTVLEAKVRWPSYADKIDSALVQLVAEK